MRRCRDERRVLYSKVGAALSIIFVPLGSTLELLVCPNLFWRILVARLLCDIFTVIVFALHFTKWGKRHIRLLTLSWVGLVQLTISWMIYMSEGAMSPYYAGLNLVMLAVAVLLPLTVSEIVVACAGTFGMYLAACFFR